MRGRPDHDPELDELFSDPDLREVANRLRAVPHRGADPDPAFRAALRRRLMSEAWDLKQARVPWYRRLLAPRPVRGRVGTGPMLAGLAGAVGIALIAYTAFTVATTRPGTTTVVTANSPLDNAQAVSLKTPILINFSQPVNHQDVQVEIQPATQTRQEWQGNTLKIIPVNDLAPNTQYQVKVAPKTDQTVAPKKVTFQTAPPPPTPTPTATPTPVPSGPPAQPEILGQRQLVAGGTDARWSADGGRLYVVGAGGQLQAVPAPAGDPQTVQPDGVTLIATGPDGVAYARGGQVVFGQTTVSNVQPIALGFRGGKLVIATSRSVLAADRTSQAKLSEEAQAARFSPGGDRLAYLGAQGLHVLDLSTGTDRLVGPATALGDWSRDGKRFAYPTEGAVAVTDGSGTSKLADLAGVTGVSWARSDQLLLATASSLQLVNGDGSGLRKLADGTFAQPEWSPSGSLFSFKRAGGIWVAQVAGTRPSPPAQGQDDVVKSFMAARKAQHGDEAMTYLDGAGKAAFTSGGAKLLSTDTALTRYYLLLSQPNHVVVRLVFADSTAVDETLTLTTEAATGRWLIHGATDSAARPFDKGPEAINVSIREGQVSVAFDSDLDPGSATTAVRLKGVSSQPSYDAKSRAVTLTVPGGLTSGSEYRLVVTSDLQDVNQQHAASFELPFTAP